LKTKTLTRFLFLVATLVVASQAWAYTFIFDDDGFAVKWTSATITMQIKVDNSTKLTDGKTRATTIQAAMNDPVRGWNHNLGVVQFSPQILAIGTGTDNDNINQIFFSSAPYNYGWDANTLAVTTDWTEGEKRVEADIIINTAFSWDSYRGAKGAKTAYDLQRVVLHELGHVLGLDHPDEAGQSVAAIMNSIISDIDSLQPDDITGAQALYGAPGVVPANDNFAGAATLTLSGTTAQLTGTSVAATKQAGEPNHGNDAGGHSVWWKWTAASSGAMTLDTAGSKFDTTLGVYTGSSISALTTIASNDDVQDGVIRTSAVSFAATSGTTYYIAVDGFGGESGSIVLNATFAPPQAPGITAQPSSASAYAGDVVTFSVSAGGSPPPTYRWQRQASGQGSWSDLADGGLYSGTTATTLTLAGVTLGMNGDQFRCVATNGSGSATSNPAGLTVTLHADAITYDSTTFPMSATVGTQLSFTYSVTNVGSNAWGANHFLVVRDADGNNLVSSSLNGVAPGASTTVSFSLAAPASPGSYTFTVQAEEMGVGWFTSSATVNLTVNGGTVNFTSRPLSRLVTAGQAVTFSASATGNGSVTYQWRHNRIAISGATRASLTIPSPSRSDSGYYEVLASDATGSASAVVYLEVAPLNGTVVAWGTDNYYGEQNVPAGLTNVMSVTAGFSASLAIQPGGTVVQWGMLISSSDLPPQGLTGVVTTAIGEGHVLALKGDGTVVAWGYNGSGETNVPAGLNNVVAVAAGAAQSLALKSDGTVVEWGDLFQGVSTTPPLGLGNVVAIACGRFDCMALRADGSIITWAGNRTVPASVNNVSMLATGWSDAMAVKTDGSVVQWGPDPVDDVPATLPDAIAVGIRMGTSGAFALRRDGTVVQWGNAGVALPAPMGNVYSISTGLTHSLALLSMTDVAPFFSLQPVSRMEAVGGNATFTVLASGMPAPSCHWQRLPASGNVWVDLSDGPAYTGTGSSTLVVSNVSTAMNGDQFRCIASNASGFAASNPAGLSIWVAGADFNRDGKDDLFWTNAQTAERRFWLLNGTAYGSEVSLGIIPPNWKMSGYGDFNGDGQPDLVWTNASTGERKIWFMNGTAYASEASLGAIGLEWVIAGAADFDGDGKSDLVWENTVTGERQIWMMNGGVAASSVSLGTIPINWSISGIADFDRDGHPDILWTNTTTGERTIWLMAGTAHSSSATLGIVPAELQISQVGDFNGDGWPDLLMTNTVTWERSIWLLNGATHVGTVSLGVITPEWTPGPGAQKPIQLARLDFNGDGQSDLLWENSATGEHYAWLMNGANLASSAFLGTLPAEWRLVATADFNGDGQPDLVWENTSTGEHYVWLMNGTNLGSSVFLGILPTQWRIAAAGDFNSDGKSDLVWENTSTGERYVWLMNGTTFVSSVFLGVVPPEWRIADTGDFNGDGQPDLVWENTTTGEHYIWLMNGTTISSSVFLGVLPVEWRMATTGDFNSDGQSDLVWENTATGERYVWLMNGTNFGSSVFLGVVPTQWRIAR
jgi:hypothetical protein